MKVLYFELVYSKYFSFLKAPIDADICVICIIEHEIQKKTMKRHPSVNKPLQKVLMARTIMTIEL